MKKAILILGILAVLGSTCLMSTSCGTNAGAKGADTLKVNTTELGAEVIGFNGITPVEISVHKGVITKIEALPNQETPKYWNACKKHLQNKWDGMKVSEAKKTEVDGRTGATFSSNAVKKNVKLAIEYYEKNK